MMPLQQILIKLLAACRSNAVVVANTLVMPFTPGQLKRISSGIIVLGSVHVVYFPPMWFEAIMSTLPLIVLHHATQEGKAARLGVHVFFEISCS